ncbi:MAG: hypothetical protein ACYDEI_00105 [Erysipelotrichaceae bacterium]
MLRLKDYIDQIRIRTDDNPYAISPYHSDSTLTTFINNARRNMAIDLKIYENQHYIVPLQYIDEYTLPQDFMESSLLIDVYNQYPITPMNKGNAESTKNIFDINVQFGNYAYINETRRKITFYKPFQNSSDVQPTYNIVSVSRSSNTIIIDGVQSTYTLGDIMNWDRVKGYIKITTAAGLIEYARVSKILADTPTTAQYTLYISSWDLKNTYKNSLQCYGTVAYATTVLTGTGTKFLTELTVGDTIVIDGITKIIASVTSDTVADVSVTFGAATSSGKTMYVSNLPTYADNDTIQFIPYLINYFSTPKDMTYLYEYDQYPIETQALIPILASVEAEMQRSRISNANANLAEYNKQLQIIAGKINKGKDNIHNDQIIAMSNYDYNRVHRS